jgi:hypothetical protein
VPPWAVSKKRQEDMDEMPSELSYPSQWAEVAVLFEYGGAMKTTEALMKLGPVGAYQFSFADCDPGYVDSIPFRLTINGHFGY